MEWLGTKIFNKICFSHLVLTKVKIAVENYGAYLKPLMS
jgi:hypothetical protein